MICLLFAPIKLLEIIEEPKFRYLICEYYNGGDLSFYLKEKKPSFRRSCSTYNEATY